MNPQAASVRVDQENLAYTDLLVYPKLPWNGFLLMVGGILASPRAGGYAVQAVAADPGVHLRGNEAR